MIAGVILAAGQAKRMGQPKQLLIVHGKPLVYHIANVCCKSLLSETIVVTGAYEPAISEALTGLPIRTVYNENWAAGQASSVVAAISSLPESAQAVIFLLADQPLISAALINSIVIAYRDTGASLVAPYFNNRRGNPVLFDLAKWRSALLKLTGDTGAREILKANENTIHRIELADGDVFLDVDMPEDFERLKKMILRKNNLS